MENTSHQGECTVAYAKKQFRRTLLSLALVGAYLPANYAASGSNIINSFPSSARTEAASRAVTSNIPATEGPQLLPPLQEGAESSKTPLGKQAEKITFVLKKVTLKGNHVYSTAVLSKLYKNKLNKKISVADLYLLAQNITNYYRNNGYIISRAILPPQKIKDGAVIIQVIEGFADKVTVGGDPDGARCIIQAYGNHIKDSRPLSLYDMEYYVMLANNLPGTQAKAVLTPSKTTPAAADIALMTSTQRFRGYISYDDYGTRYIGPQQVTANANYSSLIASGDNTQFTFASSARDKELNYSDINYSIPIFSKGLRVTAGKTRTKTHPMFVLEPVDVLGINDIYYAALEIPIIRARTMSYTITTGATVTDVDTTFAPIGAKLYIDHIRSIYASNVFGFTDRFYGNNLWALDLRAGLPVFGYSTDTNSNTAQTSRPGGHADYIKANLQLTRLQFIKGAWSAYGIVRGQFSGSALLSSDQFVFGGNLMGRGYDPSEIIGDNGFSGTLELRYDWNIGKNYFQGMQLYAFYDAGKIWNIPNITGQIKAISATSTGIGSRFNFNQYLSGNLMWTQPLTKQVDAEALIGKGYTPRVFFSMQANWA